MRRRDFIKMIAGATAVYPFAVRAQQQVHAPMFTAMGFRHAWSFSVKPQGQSGFGG